MAGFLLFHFHLITNILWSPLGYGSTQSITTKLVTLLFDIFLLYVEVSQPVRIQRLANRVLENANFLL
jgi:tryptophan-rich sensory protein